MLDVLDPDDRAHFDGLCRYFERARHAARRRREASCGGSTTTRARSSSCAAVRASSARKTRSAAEVATTAWCLELGGPDVPAIGFALGLERLLLAMPQTSPPARKSVYLAPLGEAATVEALRIARSLRRYGVVADVDGRQTSLKSMLRRANTVAATYCIVVGETEMKQGTVQVKDLAGPHPGGPFSNGRGAHPRRSDPIFAPARGGMIETPRRIVAFVVLVASLMGGVRTGACSDLREEGWRRRLPAGRRNSRSRTNR